MWIFPPFIITYNIEQLTMADHLLYMISFLTLGSIHSVPLVTELHNDNSINPTWIDSFITILCMDCVNRSFRLGHLFLARLHNVHPASNMVNADQAAVVLRIYLLCVTNSSLTKSLKFIHSCYSTLLIPVVKQQSKLCKILQLLSFDWRLTGCCRGSSSTLRIVVLRQSDTLEYHTHTPYPRRWTSYICIQQTKI
jgi:hypothetical protein